MPPGAGLALPAALPAAAGPSRKPLRRAADADHAMAQDEALPDYAKTLLPVTGMRCGPRRTRGRQRGPAPATRHAAARACGRHDGPASRLVLTPHPPGRTGLPVGTAGSTPTAWGLACRWAWDGLVVRR